MQRRNNEVEETERESEARDATEADTLLENEPQIELLVGHKRECAIAFLLSTFTFLCDIIRWILLLVYHDHLHAYYYYNVNLTNVVVMSVSWDFVVFIICAMVYNLHKQWIQLPSYITWRRFFALYIAIASRLFMMVPMILGHPGAARGLLAFVFFVQILYYFSIIITWMPVMKAYAEALMRSELEELRVITESREPPRRQAVVETTEMSSSLTRPLDVSTMNGTEVVVTPMCESVVGESAAFLTP